MTDDQRPNGGSTAPQLDGPAGASTAVRHEFPVTLTAVLDMSYADYEGRSNDEPYGVVMVRIQIGEESWRGPTLPVVEHPDYVAGREAQIAAKKVAQWTLDLAEKGHGHHVR